MLQSLTTNGVIGGSTMASLVKQALSQCPNTKVVVSGYSQGAEVVHNAMSTQGLKSGQVAAAVLFGDPDMSSSVANIPKGNVMENCAFGDVICEMGVLIVTAAHLTYGAYAGAAAQFAIKATGL
jgi:cutinase